MIWWLMAGIAIGAIVLMATVTVLVMRRGRGLTSLDEQPRRISIALAIEADDAADPRVQRLVTDAASRMFRLMPSLEEIEIKDRKSRVLGHQRRSGSHHPDLPAPIGLYEPHTVRRPATPSRWNDEPRSDVESARGSMRAIAGGWLHDVPEPAPRALTERFELTDELRARIEDPDDALQMVAAILEQGGRPVRSEGGALWAGDAFISMIRTPPGASVTAGSLARAYAAFRASGAPHGYVVVFGHVDPIDIRRRELLAPQLVHLGAAEVQRMADAASLGADPLRSACAPAIGESLAMSPEETSEKKRGER